MFPARLRRLPRSLGRWGWPGAPRLAVPPRRRAAPRDRTASQAFDEKTWDYDSTNDVCYQIGKPYVTNPAASNYATLGIYVPGKYLTSTRNRDGTSYTAKVKGAGKVGDDSATTAPIVFRCPPPDTRHTCRPT